MKDAKKSTKTHAKKKNQSLISKNYYSDMDYDGMLYAAILRSPSQNGIISKIVHPTFPEGCLLFTNDDLPGKKEVDILGQSIPIFCSGKVSYIGEPIGILVGPDESVVNNLLSEIEIVFDDDTIENVLSELSFEKEPINIVENTNLSESKQTEDTNASDDEIEAITKALNLEPVNTKAKETKEKTKQKKVIDDVIAERNVKTGLATSKTKEFDALFSKKNFCVEQTWSSVLSSSSCTEPNGAFCVPGKHDITLYTPTQWPTHLQRDISEILKIPFEDVNIKKTNSSSPHTNSLLVNTILSLQVVLASIKTKKPVKLVLTRQEHLDFLHNKGNILITHKTAVSKDERIEAMKIDIVFDAGCYNPFAQEILDRLVIASCGIYNVKNICITAKAISSEKPSSSENLESLDSQAFFAMENQIQKICDLKGYSPIQFRLKNIRLTNTRKNYMPFNFNLKKIEETLTGLERISDLERHYVSYRMESMALRQNRTEYKPYNAFLRGVGFACGLDGSGYFGTNIVAGEHKMDATLDVDGVLSIHALPPSASILEIWKNVASEILQIDAKNVKLNSEFDINDDSLIPENMYSNLSIMTQLLKKCCNGIQLKRFRSPLPITVSKKITSQQIKQWNKDKFSGIPFHSTSFAAAVVKLDVDACTFKINIREIDVIINAGKILIGKAAEQTVRLSINHVLSEILEEETLDCKKIKITFIQSESEPCQLGGLIAKVLPSAFSSALSQALAKDFTKVPVNGDSLYVSELEQDK